MVSACETCFAGRTTGAGCGLLLIISLSPIKLALTILAALMLTPLRVQCATGTLGPAVETSIIEVKNSSALTSLVRFQPYRHVIA